MRQRNQNIPIEIFRTILAISETGSLTKAAIKLGLSQPAVSAQMKRIETIVGGSIFQKTASGSMVTALGKLVIAQARKILEANDQTLALGGVSAGPGFIRLGLSSLLVRHFIAHQGAGSLNDVQIVSDRSAIIASALLEGHIDIACILQNPDVEDIASLVVEEFEEQLIWVRSRDFVLSPGAPIPILTWTGDDWMTRTLIANGLSYRIAFNGMDFDAKVAAVEAGIGISAVPQMLLPPSLVHAKEYYLPKLPTIRGLLCVRPGLNSSRVMQLRAQISAAFFGEQQRAIA